MLFSLMVLFPIYGALEFGQQAAASTSFHFDSDSPASPYSEAGETIFSQKCKVCHSIGQGRMLGPDLKGVTGKRDREWLVRFIVAPDKLIAQGDPIAGELLKEYGIPMPNLGLSGKDAGEVLDYIDEQSGSSGNSLTPVSPPSTAGTVPPEIGSNPPAGKPTVAAAATSGDAGHGKDIFTGRVPLKNGGPSCLSCHNISSAGALGGGVVGKDLSDSYKILGDAGLNAILKTVPFPMMKEIYTQKPLTDGETASLMAFFKEDNPAEKTGQGKNTAVLFLIGAAGALVVIGIFQLAWRKRLYGVRRRLVKGDSK
ncbi:MAG: c-type cytochrome [Dehalococcoidia bacterium]|nr:c-type cytochrome [Dehalococcoidia bacterium]